MAAGLRVDWPACEARGLCHEVLPELVDLDEWGYPIVRGPVTEDLLDRRQGGRQGLPPAGPPPRRRSLTDPRNRAGPARQLPPAARVRLVLSGAPNG